MLILVAHAPGPQAKPLAMVSRASGEMLALIWDTWQEDDVIGCYPLTSLLRAWTTPEGS
jgi:hypothetical protein